MGEFFRFVFGFFHGWRRKIGFATLLMACLFAVGWVRSLWVMDTVSFPTGGFEIIALMSGDQRIGTARIHEQAPEFFVPIWGVEKSDDIDAGLEDPEISCHYRWWGFVSFEIADPRTKLWLVPYWSITIPLTLISMGLLFSTFCKPIQQKTIDLVATERNKTMRYMSLGWRRKLGIATLFMASMGAISWGVCRYNPYLINGLFDSILPIDEGSIGLFTEGSSLSLVKYKGWDTTFEETTAVDNSSETSTTQQPENQKSKSHHPITDEEAQEILRAIIMADKNRCSLIAVPFWLIVMPLAVISLCLLFPNPRKSNQKKTVEPAPAERK